MREKGGAVVVVVRGTYRFQCMDVTWILIATNENEKAKNNMKQLGIFEQ